MISKITSTIVILSVTLVILTTPVSAQTSVNVNAPGTMDGDFTVTIEIEDVTDMDSGQFDLHFDATAVNVTGVDDGSVGGTAIPVENWAVDDSKVKVLFNLPGLDGVSGSGSLATIHFETIVPGDCEMEISDGLLVNTMAELIPASWDGVESHVSSTTTSGTEDIHADTSGSEESEELETPGFGALFAIGILATVIFAFRKR
ncbi:MAG: cohesin domain-containing protein [Euryarchaeota archaeon]|nr:cohesin domain-containing protein [Euryarchaeota archaeon]